MPEVMILFIINVIPDDKMSGAIVRSLVPIQSRRVDVVAYNDDKYEETKE